MIFILSSVNAGWAQKPPSRFAERFRNLSKISDETVEKECESLFTLLVADKALARNERANGLDTLRDACSRRLQWNGFLLARIADAAVAERRPIEADNPGALCKSLCILGISYEYRLGREKAQVLYKEAEEIARRWLNRGSIGTTTEDVAGALDSLSSVLADKGDLTEALRVADESEALHRASGKPDSIVTALTVRARVELKINLDTTYLTLMDALDRSQELGPDFDLGTARVESNLGEVLFRKGDLARAITYLRDAERLRLKPHSGQPARSVAATQLLLGEVLYKTGDYPHALEYFEKAVLSHKKWLGDEPYRYCDALMGRAAVLEETGQWEKALEDQNAALLIRERGCASAGSQAGTELQIRLARSLTGLGGLQQRMGSPSARGFLERALKIENDVLATQPNVDRARTLLELAEYWRQDGDRVRASNYIEACLRELGKLKDTGPLLLDAMETKARVTVNPTFGLRVIREAIRKAKDLYGPESPRVAGGLKIQSELMYRHGNSVKALEVALKSQRMSLPHVKSIVQAFPRDQALVFAADRREALDLALQLTTQTPRLEPDLVKQVWQQASGSRMLVRDAEIDRERLLRATLDPELTAVAKNLTSARERFAYALVQTQGTGAERSKLLEEASVRLNEAQKFLATKARSWKTPQEARFTVEMLGHRLPAGNSLVAIYQYQRRVSGSPESSDYMAFVLNDPGAVHVVTLGNARDIDGLITRWRDAVLNPRADPLVRKGAGLNLRRAVWEPIEKQLSVNRSVFVVPDGALYLVPMAALPGRTHPYLVEENWAFHNITTERDLLVQPHGARLGPLLAVGDVDYNRFEGNSSKIEIALSERQEGLGVIPSLSRDANRCLRRGLPFFSLLPGSRNEVQYLDQLWRTLKVPSTKNMPAFSQLSGRNATESALKKAVLGRRVIHLATHGFVWSGGGCYRRQLVIRGTGSLHLGTKPGTRPLLFSGLVLAGANNLRKASRSEEDGILTEEEIVGLDLRAADWVSLSACQSGLGDIQPSEGVVGLLRAFQVAGAKTVIVSLWSVDDQATQVWMQRLYEARFLRKKTIMEAVHMADLGSMAFYRSQGDDNPAKWAGFVANGYWN